MKQSIGKAPVELTCGLQGKVIEPLKSEVLTFRRVVAGAMTLLNPFQPEATYKVSLEIQIPEGGPLKYDLKMFYEKGHDKWYLEKIQ